MNWKKKKMKNKKPLIILPALILVTLISFQVSGKERCIECHVRGGEAKTVIHLSELRDSVHKKLTCGKCHGDILYPHKEIPPVDCSKCHKKETEDYLKSTHGRARKEGISEAPDCKNCHGKHETQKLNRLKIPELCFSCHTDQTITEKYKIPGVEFIKAYEKSIHGHAVFSLGLLNAPVCSDCHNSHQVLPPADPDSTINHRKIPDLCGRCHRSEREEYQRSIHGQAIEKDIRESPVCTDCHGEHTISVVTDPNATISPGKLPNTCARCHDNVKLAERFGFRSKRLATYLNTFHGVANIYGSTVVANCASCHGYHLILPSTDPASPIYPDNIPKTCGKCHPGAGVNYAKGPIHVEPVPEVSKPAYYVRTFYTWFIAFLCIVFVIHIIMDYAGYRKKKKSFAQELKIDEDEKP